MGVKDQNAIMIDGFGVGDLNLVWLRICQLWANSEWQNRMVHQQRWRGTKTTIFFLLDLGLLPASFSKNIFLKVQQNILTLFSVCFETAPKRPSLQNIRAIYNSYLIL